MAKAVKKTTSKPKKRERKNIVAGHAHIHATFGKFENGFARCFA